MTQVNKGIDISSARLRGKKGLCKQKEAKIDIMIRGYQEMAEINLTISRHCFEVESEADRLCIRPTECE